MQKYTSFIVLSIIIIVLTFVFGQVISFDFLLYDDGINVKDNPLVTLPTIQNLVRIWDTPQYRLYIPVTYTFWHLTGRVSTLLFDRLDPGLFHLSNLLIHVSNVWLVYSIIKFLIGQMAGRVVNRWCCMGALVGALVFGIHPLQVEPVAWITGAKDVLSAFFALSAILLYLKLVFSHEEGLSPYRPLLTSLAALTLFCLSVLSKPTTVIVPIIVLLLSLMESNGKWRERISFLVPWFVVACIFVVITTNMQSGNSSGGDYPWYLRPIVACDAITFYVSKYLFPATLHIDYGRTPEIVLQSTWSFLSLVLPVASIGAFQFMRAWKVWGTCAAIFVAGLLPVLGLVPFDFQQQSTVADRYIYLAMLGPSLALGFLIHHAQSRVFLLVALLLIVVLGIRSTYQCQHWKNTLGIMQHTLTKNPISYTANLNNGIALMHKGRFSESIEYYQIAIKLKPDKSLGYYNFGIALAGLQNESAAWEQYKKLKVLDAGRAESLRRAIVIMRKQHSIEKRNNIKEPQY